MGRRGAVLGLALLAASAATYGAVATLLANGSNDSPVLRTMPLSQTPWGMVVDSRTERAFIFGSSYPYVNGDLMVIDTATGRLIRHVNLPFKPAALAASLPSGHIFLSGVVRRISMLDARTGTLIRAIAVPAMADILAMDQSGGRLIATSFGAGDFPGRITVIDAVNGRVVRSFRVHGTATSVTVDGRADRVLVAGRVGGDEFVLMTGTLTAAIYDAEHGWLLHKVAPGTNEWHTSLVDETTGRAFVLTSDASLVGPYAFNVPRSKTKTNTIRIFDLRSGALLHVTPLQSAPYAVALDERAGRVFVATLGPLRQKTLYLGGGFAVQMIPTGNGSVSMVDANSGRVLRTVPVGMNPSGVALNVRSGRVFVANAGTWDYAGFTFSGPGTVSVLDATTGTVLRTLPVGVGPTSLAVDDRANRLVVVCRGGVVRVPGRWQWVPSWLRRWLPFPPARAPYTQTVSARVTVPDTSRL